MPRNSSVTFRQQPPAAVEAIPVAKISLDNEKHHIRLLPVVPGHFVTERATRAIRKNRRTAGTNSHRYL
jgi:hypothetical protein